MAENTQKQSEMECGCCRSGGEIQNATEEKILAYRQMLDILSRTTDDFLFLLDIEKDINWFFGPVDARYAIREEGQLSNTTAQMLAVVHPGDRMALTQDLGRVAQGVQDSHDMNYRWIDRQGKTVWISCRGTVIRDESGRPSLMVGRVSEEALRHLYNPENGFWNKTKLLEDLKELDWSGQSNLMLLEIDDLPAINLAYGREYGDLLVKEFGGQLEQNPAVTKVYQLGFNRMAVIAAAGTNAEAGAVYDRIHRGINGRFEIHGAAAPISREVFTDAEGLIDSVNLLLIKAQQDAAGSLELFTKADVDKSVHSIALLDEMKKSIEQGFAGFEVYYQPQLLSGSYELYGMEALLRYFTESGERVMPNLFIPILEKSGLIKEVGIWVLEQSMLQCKQWRKYYPKLRISVNFSVVQFDDQDITKHVMEVLERTGMPVDALTIEITESVELRENSFFEEHANHLQAMGIHLSLDDFGIGCANFDDLTTLAVNEIKIDRLFIKDIDQSAYNYSLAKNVIGFARSNGIMACCEGVEREEELAILEDLQAGLFQGYLFDKPCTAQQIQRAYMEPDTPEYRQRAAQREKLRWGEEARSL